MHPAPGDRRLRSRQLARQTRGTPTRRHAADVAGTHRSRRPVEAPDLALLRCPGDPYGNHQPGSSLQGSPLRLRYSAWFVIRSLPVTPGCPSKPCAAACSRGPVRGAHLFRSLRADLCSSFRRIRRHVPAAPRGPVRQRNSFRVLHPALCQLGRAVLVSAGELRVASAAWQHAAGTPAGWRDGCC